MGLHRQKLDQHGGMSRVVWYSKKALKTDTNFTLSYKKSRSFFGRHPNKLKNIVLPPLKKIKKVNYSLQLIAYTTTTKIPEKNHIAKFPNILMKNQKYTSQN